MKIFEVKSDIVGIRFDKFLCKKFDISFGLAQKLIREKKVKLESFDKNQNISKRDLPTKKLEIGDKITIFEDIENRKEKVRTEISENKFQNFLKHKIFEDKNLIAINKPSGLAVQGGSGITVSVDDYVSKRNWQLVHRLDKDTSGVLLIAKNKKIADYLVEKFKKKQVQKTYQALVFGNLQKESGVIEIPLKKKMENKHEKVRPDFEDGKEAISKFKLIQNFDKYSIVELTPITGRTHQLRVHMKEVGHPIINDIKYGGPKVKMKNLCSRLCLHAKNLVIEDYFGEKLEIIAVNKGF
jgi:23S rRNA pseudouridine955/2504/2580 synthase